MTRKIIIKVDTLFHYGLHIVTAIITIWAVLGYLLFMSDSTVCEDNLYTMRYYTDCLDLKRSWWDAPSNLFKTLESSLKWIPLIQMFVTIEFDYGDVVTSPPTVEFLKGKLNRTIAIVVAGLKWMTYIPSKIRLPNSAPIVHPVDHFVKRLFMKFNYDAVTDAFSRYRRVNPTFELKAKFLAKFDVKPDRFTEQQKEEISNAIDSIYDDILPVGSRLREEFLKALAYNIDNYHDHSMHNIDMTTAAGYPYPAGTKKRNVFDVASRVSDDLFIDDHAFSEYMSKHVWYTGGRAKLVDANAEDSARMIEYAGFSSHLLSLKYFTPFISSFVHGAARSFSAIGMSWTKNGADKLIEKIGAIHGMAEPGKNFFSTDVSGFDYSVDRFFLEELSRKETELIRSAPCYNVELREKYCRRLRAIRNDMINAVVLLPGGHSFQTVGGMKSGWSGTSVDDTIIHEVLWRIFEKRTGKVIPRQVYGDDFIGVRPDALKDSTVIAFFGEFGFKIKHIHSGKRTSDVDFLSKNIMYNHGLGHYYPWRAEVETYSRLLMPEEFDVARRTAPDPVVAAERFVGHLFDNPFNLEVREFCFSVLRYLSEHYHITEVDVTKMMPYFKYRGIDIPFRTMPCVPDPSFIDLLYGIDSRKLSSDIFNDAKGHLLIPEYDFDMRDSDDSHAIASEFFSNSVSVLKGKNVSSRANLIVKQFSRHFRVPDGTFGTAGCKFLEFVRKFSLDREKLLFEIGTHPGSTMQTAISYGFANVRGVSLYPKEDERDGRAFCYKVDETYRDRVLRGSWRDAMFPAASYVIYDSYDISRETNTMEDVSTFVDDMINDAKECFDKAVRFMPDIEVFICRVHGFTPNVYQKLYEMAKVSKGFDIFKPVYSYPWQSEYYCAFMFDKHAFIPRRAAFFQSLNSFRNRMASRIVAWSKIRSQNLSRHRQGRALVRCPLQEDDDVQNALKYQIGYFDYIAFQQLQVPGLPGPR